MDKKKKNDELKKALSIFWNSYQHMYDARERKAKGMIDFLLVISTFLPILSVTLYTTCLFSNPLILLPIIPQLVSIIILLKHFVVGTPAVHWFELKNSLNSLEKGDFEIKTIAVLKKLENLTFVSLKEERKLIKYSRGLILFSLFLLYLSTIFILFGDSLQTYVLTILLLIIFYYVAFIFYKKRPDFSSQDGKDEEYLKQIKDWFNKNEK